ncbi:PD-(D/E)XK nuclease family protein [Methanospirillum purgamenti]|uniref:PD-(D/E)XK nuclease family protein n=1 Tax=Methanospirillum purgamenti TaxID=2834276 RepID=UPI0021131AD5|nr:MULTISPECIES: PD-(D/E)XK nuclease family protein [Methanospirillum]MDX8551984.1 PD-(D/E)XK nuclease family protein [Methanospirillum hungatei]
MKDLTPKNALQGKVVHEILEEEIKNSTGKEPDLDGMVARYQKKINQYEMTAQTTVIEFFNGGSDKTFFDTIRKTWTENQNRFVSDIWPSLQHNRYIRHEGFDYCLVDNTRVLLKVDYISQEPDGTLVITDWKTGIEQEENSINKLQMQVYALWAGKYFRSYADRPPKKL